MYTAHIYLNKNISSYLPPNTLLLQGQKPNAFPKYIYLSEKTFWNSFHMFESKTETAIIIQLSANGSRRIHKQYIPD